jgi:predicted ATP-dependent serine protease
VLSNDGSKSPHIVQRASDIVEERTDWMWFGRIPAGHLSRIDGDPGLGKSVMALDLAARVSNGDPMPGEEVETTARDVLVLAAEDDKVTIRRRLHAAGADLNRVHITISDEISFPADLDWLEDQIGNLQIRLVIIDPLIAFLGPEINSNQDQDVRKALRPLRGIAERTGAAILFVGHLNKNGKSRAVYRSMGSMGLLASVRVAMLVAGDRRDAARRVLLVSKSNLGTKPDSWVFEVTDGGGDPIVKWVDTIDVTADELLAQPAAASVDKGSRAKALLLELLSTKDVLGSEILAEASRRGIGESIIRRAKRELGVEHHDLPSTPGEKGHGPSVWRLPDAGQRSMTAQPTTSTDLKPELRRRRKRRPEPPDRTVQ